MKKFGVSFLLFIACFCTIFFLCACNLIPNNSAESNDQTKEPEPVIIPPTAAQIVEARQNAVSTTVQGYDFSLTFTGDFSVLGLGKALSGKYDGYYRHDGDNDKVMFKRTTSGALLADSTCYIFTSGDSRIKATMDGNVVKKISVETPEEQNVTMINLPVVAIIDSMTEGNISNIIANKNSKYAYSCQLSVGNNNIVYAVLGMALEKLGTGVSFKGIDLVGNTSSLDFNIKDGKLNDFRFGFDMQINVNAVKVVLRIDYEQQDDLTTISLPNVTNSGLIYSRKDIQTEINTINAAIADLKASPAYSLDLTAKNEFDPGWNKFATVDSFTARMYKRTIDDVDWFNNSYYYKAHSEVSGKETYKYTLGNVNGTNADNQGTWLISRKGTNAQKQVGNISADMQFDFLTDVVKLETSGIDCIKKQVEKSETAYTLYIGKTATKSLQVKIVSMINTNPYDEVIKVNNYFNLEHIIKEARIKIVINDGQIVSIACETELCYTPTGGEYTEYNITLNNSVELKVNENLEQAQSYIPPTKVTGVMGFGKNLNDSEYYIL